MSEFVTEILQTDILGISADNWRLFLKAHTDSTALQDIQRKIKTITKIPKGLLLAVFSLLCLVQISPIKINPWDTILGWIGTKINAGVKKDLDEVSRQTSIQKEEFREFWVDYQREAILRFSREWTTRGRQSCGSHGSARRKRRTAGKNGTTFWTLSKGMKPSVKSMT